MPVPKKLNTFNAEITKLCANHDDFLQLLDNLIAAKPASKKIPNNWKTLNDVLSACNKISVTTYAAE